MADNYTLCLVGVMDRLWFHQIIVFSESISLLCHKTPRTPQPTSESFICASPNPFQSPLSGQQISSDSSAITSPQDDSNNEDEEKEIKQKERPTRFGLNTSKIRSHSSSPSTQKRPKNLRYASAMGRLQKNMSCKSLGELELEEVKGFMDLGFIFKKEQLSPRMLRVVPGLQRLGEYINKPKTKVIIDDAMVAKDGAIEEVGDKRGTMRPYLSEAWLIKRPDSPLLNLRIPRASAAADMKKHLRFWARTVASVIQQES
ncbi:hypothetical protein L1049_001677 [Liquidambar formosana]|uniref:Uncharacterized protein n=1 Tax=Liquidambar formosana TaxID=63359 RepID=A0AAP0QXS1_LIQFO